MSEPSPLLRPAAPADHPVLDALYAAVFGAAAGAAHAARRRWQYDANPFAARPELLVAEADGALVGQTGGLPVPLLVAGAPRRAAWGCDTLVDPAWRRRGLASRLVDAWRERCEHELSLGLDPAPGLRAVLLASGHRVLGRVDGHLARGDAPPAPLATTVAPLAVDDPRIAALWRAVGPAYGALVARDGRWLAWRYAASPLAYALFGATRGDALVGYSALRPTPRAGGTTLLVDWLADPGDRDAHAALFAHARAWGRPRGVDQVFAYACERRQVAHLRASGFVANPDFAAELIAGGPAARDLPGLPDWHITLGDSDKDRPP